MSIEERRIVDFLALRPNLFVSAAEIARYLDRRKYEMDRTWATPMLRRMEMDKLLEMNHFGEFRLKQSAENRQMFKEALAQPGAKLGDTTIIILDTKTESAPAPAPAAVRIDDSIPEGFIAKPWAPNRPGIRVSTAGLPQGYV